MALEAEWLIGVHNGGYTQRCTNGTVKNVSTLRNALRFQGDEIVRGNMLASLKMQLSRGDIANKDKLHAFVTK